MLRSCCNWTGRKTLKEEGPSIRPRKIPFRYFKILSDGDIEGNYPDVTYDDSSKFFKLDIEMKTKTELQVMFGGNVSSTSMNQAYVGLEYRRIGLSSQTYNFDGYPVRLYSSLSLRGRTDFFMKALFSLDYGHNFNYYNYFKSNFGGIAKKTDLTYSRSISTRMRRPR